VKKLIFVIGASLLFACDVSKPLGILSEDDMVNLLIDIHITQAELQVRNFGHENSKMIYNRVLQDSIVKKRGWEMEQVQESMDYYLNNIPVYSDIYERVLDSLTLKESLIRKE
jgi:hypothetical protein